MPSSSADIDSFPLSWLSQYAYCPRRCGLLALEQVWEENEYTASGRLEHERVHNNRIERRGNDLYLYETPVFSKRMGLSGKCDCIEARRNDDGAEIPYGAGKYELYPVEYKHGIIRDEHEYKIQLCAQVMCLEEQFSCSVLNGAIFFIDAHRRVEVNFAPELRAETLNTALLIRKMLDTQLCPSAKYSARCKKCSVSEYCQPKVKRSAAAYCSELLEAIEEGRE